MVLNEDIMFPQYELIGTRGNFRSIYFLVGFCLVNVSVYIPSTGGSFSGICQKNSTLVPSARENRLKNEVPLDWDLCLKDTSEPLNSAFRVMRRNILILPKTTSFNYVHTFRRPFFSFHNWENKRGTFETPSCPHSLPPNGHLVPVTRLYEAQQRFILEKWS